jgi:hypothetical protein
VPRWSGNWWMPAGGLPAPATPSRWTGWP